MDDLTPDEGLAGLTEQFIQCLEIGGADSVRAALAGIDDLPAFAYALESSGHPATAGLAELRTLAIGPALKATRRGLHAVPGGNPHPRPKRPKNKRKRKR